MTEISTEVKGASMAPASTTIFGKSPEAMLAEVTTVANSLQTVIEQQKLAVKIGQGKHLKVEGWSTMGSMLGIMPREKAVTENGDGSFTAEVELINISTGVIVGIGSGLCGDKTDGHWAKKPAHARRSMAITRATGRAYRLGLSWIVTMAGYQPTPAEEMQDYNIFDMGNDEQCLKLHDLLKQLKITEREKWERVSLVLHKKEFTKENIAEALKVLQIGATSNNS